MHVHADTIHWAENTCLVTQTCLGVFIINGYSICISTLQSDCIRWSCSISSRHNRSLSTYLCCASKHFFVYLCLHLDRFGVTRYLFQNQCREVCPEGFFQSARMRCDPCPADCSVCAAADHCLQCSPGHKLRHDHCFQLECSTGERCCSTKHQPLHRHLQTTVKKKYFYLVDSTQIIGC